MKYSSNSNHQFQDQFQDDFHNDYRHVQSAPPNNGCKRKLGRWCDNQFCPKHGYNRRIKIKNRFSIETLGEPAGEVYHVAAHYGTTLTADAVRTVNRCFFDKLDYHYPGIGYVWRQHWSTEPFPNTPHLHMILLYYTNCGKTDLKNLWCRCLRRIDCPSPCRLRFGCEPARNGYEAMLWYLHRTRTADHPLPAEQCPPRLQDQRWCYGGSNRAFLTYFTHSGNMADRLVGDARPWRKRRREASRTPGEAANTNFSTLTRKVIQCPILTSCSLTIPVAYADHRNTTPTIPAHAAHFATSLG